MMHKIIQVAVKFRIETVSNIYGHQQVFNRTADCPAEELSVDYQDRYVRITLGHREILFPWDVICEITILREEL